MDGPWNVQTDLHCFRCLGRVAFGLSRVLIELNLATAFTTYSILTIMMMLNAYLLFRFIRDWTVP